MPQGSSRVNRDFLRVQGSREAGGRAGRALTAYIDWVLPRRRRCSGAIGSACTPPFRLTGLRLFR